MNPDGTYDYTFVNAVDGTFRVHRRGCADITLRAKNGAWEVKAKNVEAAIQQERESFREDFGDSADDFEFVVLPCAEYAWKWQGKPTEAP